MYLKLLVFIFDWEVREKFLYQECTKIWGFSYGGGQIDQLNFFDSL